MVECRLSYILTSKIMASEHRGCGILFKIMTDELKLSGVLTAKIISCESSIYCILTVKIMAGERRMGRN